MDKAQKKSIPKGKKKKWFKIIAPKSFNKQVLGESYVYDPKQLLGKNMKVNLMTLTRDPKKQNINLNFQVLKLDGDTGLAEIKGFVMMPAFLKRIVRRGKNRVDLSFTCRTKDKLVRVKPIMLTRSLTHNPILTDLRKTAYEKILKVFATYTFEDLINDLISYRLQMKIRKELSKIYPLKSFDIRVIKEEVVKKRRGTKEEEEAEAVVEEVPEAVVEEKPESKGKTDDLEEETSVEEETPVAKPETEENREESPVEEEKAKEE